MGKLLMQTNEALAAVLVLARPNQGSAGSRLIRTRPNIRSVLTYLDCVPLIAMDINIFISRFIFGNKIIRSR